MQTKGQSRIGLARPSRFSRMLFRLCCLSASGLVPVMSFSVVEPSPKVG